MQQAGPASLSISWKYLIESIRFLKGRPKQNNLLVPENASKLELEKGQQGRVEDFQSLTRVVIGQIFNPDQPSGLGLRSRPHSLVIVKAHLLLDISAGLKHLP